MVVVGNVEHNACKAAFDHTFHLLAPFGGYPQREIPICRNNRDIIPARAVELTDEIIPSVSSYGIPHTTYSVSTAPARTWNPYIRAFVDSA